MSKKLTIDESAEQLGASRRFVLTMVEKGRLEPDADGLIDAEQLQALAELMDKLKDGGFAAMLGAMNQH